MDSRLINVRLDPERIRKARALRVRGVPLSTVVREAIDERYDALQREGARRDIKAILGRVFERYPDADNLPPRGYDVHDRRAARRAVRRKLRSRRR